MPDAPESSLGEIILAVQERLRQHLNAEGLDTASVSHFGSFDIDPGALAYCIQVKTDEEERTADRESLMELAREWLKEQGYPPEAAGRIAVRIDSEETVYRDYNGNWYLYYK